jgi:hypothetical protein
MLVFYSPDSLERLANAQTFFIFMDGTFYVAPHPFKQLYTIRDSTIHHTTEQSEVVVALVEMHQTKLLYLSP